MTLTSGTVQEAPKRSNPIPNVAGTLTVYTQSTYSFHSQTEKREIRVVDLATGQSYCVTENPNARSPQWISRSNRLIWLEWLENGNTDMIVGDAQCPTEIYKAGTLPGQAFDLKVTGQLIFRHDDDNQLAFAISGRANPDMSLANPKQIVESGDGTGGRVRDESECSSVSGLKNSIWYGYLRRPSEPGSRYSISEMRRDSDPESAYNIAGISNLVVFAGLEGLESPVSPLGGEESSREFEISPFGMSFVARDPEGDGATPTACSCYVHPVMRWDRQDPDPVCYQPWRYRGLGGAISSLAVDQTNENRPIVFLSQKRDGAQAHKNRIIYVAAPMSDAMYEIFASADGNGLWDLSPCAVSFGNNGTLLIRAEQNGRMMLYHLQLRSGHSDNPGPNSLLATTSDQLRPEAKALLRLVDPWGFGSITYATPVRSDPAIVTPPPEAWGSNARATTVREDYRILIAHSGAGEPPAWYIFDLDAPTESPKMVSASPATP